MGYMFSNIIGTLGARGFFSVPLCGISIGNKQTNKQTQTFTSNLIRTVPFSAPLMSVIRREDRAKQNKKHKKEMRKSLNGRKVIRSSVLTEYFLTHLINI